MVTLPRPSRALDMGLVRGGAGGAAGGAYIAHMYINGIISPDVAHKTLVTAPWSTTPSDPYHIAIVGTLHVMGSNVSHTGARDNCLIER